MRISRDEHGRVVEVELGDGETFIVWCVVMLGAALASAFLWMLRSVL